MKRSAKIKATAFPLSRKKKRTGVTGSGGGAARGIKNAALDLGKGRFEAQTVEEGADWKNCGKGPTSTTKSSVRWVSETTESKGRERKGPAAFTWGRLR